MLRILRCEKSKVSPKILSYALYADDFKKEIKSALGEEYSEIISKAEISGDYVNFVTPLSGELDKVTEANKIKYQDALNVLEHRRDKVIEYLKSSTPLSNRALETHRKEFSDIIASDNTVFMVNGQAVIAPVSFNPHYKGVAVPPTGATTVPVKKRGCLLPFLLLLLLLLLLLFLLWWFLLRPWPFEGNFTDRFNSLFPQKEVPTQVVAPKKEDEAKPATTEEKTEPVEEEAKDPVVEEKEKTAEPEAVEDEEAKAAQEKAKADALKSQEEAKAKAKAQAKAKAEAEAKRKAEEQKQKELAAKRALEEKNKVPKCKTLKQEGKMPELAIAFDGSQSMLLKYGYTNRLKAAQKAATDLISNVDKNVKIGFIEINGCPVAKNRGFFGPNSRGALINAINNVNPYSYDGKTPLVNGLNELSKTLDGVNSDAVGILISDGEDTCPFTEQMDVCYVAKKIHERQPKLKIHTILIGDDIDSAACIARNTGGKVFKPKDAVQIESVLKEAGASLKKVCEE